MVRRSGVYLLMLFHSHSFSLPVDATLQVPNAKVRELFMAFNLDTHPASLLR